MELNDHDLWSDLETAAKATRRDLTFWYVLDLVVINAKNEIRAEKLRSGPMKWVWDD